MWLVLCYQDVKHALLSFLKRNVYSYLPKDVFLNIYFYDILTFFSVNNSKQSTFAALPFWTLPIESKNLNCDSQIFWNINFWNQPLFVDAAPTGLCYFFCAYIRNCFVIFVLWFLGFVSRSLIAHKIFKFMLIFRIQLFPLSVVIHRVFLVVKRNSLHSTFLQQPERNYKIW